MLKLTGLKVGNLKTLIELKFGESLSFLLSKLAAFIHNGDAYDLLTLFEAVLAGHKEEGEKIEEKDNQA